jgi:hypothetical protein
MPTPPLCLTTISTHIAPEVTVLPEQEILEMVPRELTSGCLFQLALL